jgi:predicted ArsR family transcriptional regulator
MRVILALVGKKMTAQQLTEVLMDVPQATLYRHINKLVHGGVLVEVERRPVRGTVEKVYALVENAATLSAQDMAHASSDDHVRYFLTFLVSLLDDFSRYTHADGADFLADGAGYRQVPLYLSDQEFQELVGALNTAVMRVAANQPAPGRRRRTFTTIVIPEAEGTEDREQGTGDRG